MANTNEDVHSIPFHLENDKEADKAKDESTFDLKKRKKSCFEYFKILWPML
jgi:hypothetical protein